MRRRVFIEMRRRAGRVAIVFGSILVLSLPAGVYAKDGNECTEAV